MEAATHLDLLVSFDVLSQTVLVPSLREQQDHPPPHCAGPDSGLFLDLVLLALDSGSPAGIMPTSRPGSEPVEFWVDGSRRDGTVEDFYTLGSELGRGATSIVYRCEEKQTQKPFAVKVLKKTIDKKIVRTEIGVLLRLSHPNIV
ncbi:hypothetical protein CHARACLAT_023694, partial [Characodon lateralis]|nr:hypothetical protein [Characodon lateralis]